MPIQDTFFASRFGQVQDRFGLNWMILNERPVQPQLRKVLAAAK